MKIYSCNGSHKMVVYYCNKCIISECPMVGKNLHVINCGIASNGSLIGFIEEITLKENACPKCQSLLYNVNSASDKRECLQKNCGYTEII